MPRFSGYQEYDPGGGPPPPRSDTSTSSSRRTPIGIPEDYPIPGGAPVPGVTFAAREGQPAARNLMFTRYFAGDELLPANYSADRIVQIQFNLERVGLLSRGNYSLGIWDPPTVSAYKDLLSLANARGQSAEQTLNEYLAIAEAGGGPQTSTGMDVPPLVISKTPAEELETVFRRTAIELTGRGWNSDQISQAISAYNQIEAQRQQEAYNARYLTGVGEVTAIPSPESFIESRIRQTEPEEVAAETGLSFINDFLRLATSPTWGR